MRQKLAAVVSRKVSMKNFFFRDRIFFRFFLKNRQFFKILLIATSVSFGRTTLLWCSFNMILALHLKQNKIFDKITFLAILGVRCRCAIALNILIYDNSKISDFGVM